MAAENAKFNAVEVQYRNIKEQRIQIVKKIEEMVSTANDLISTENELVGELEADCISRNARKVKLSEFKESMSSCVLTMGLYDEFKEQNQKHIDKINRILDTKWLRFESQCSSWSTHALCLWLRHTIAKHSVSQSVVNTIQLIEWDDVERRLFDRNVRGKHLPHLRERMLQFSGIENMTMIRQMVSEIDRLVKEHKEFTNLWNSFESKWMQWNVEELIEWMQYETMLIECGAIDWSATSELLRTQNMTGKNLPQMNELVFSLIGINHSVSIEYLMVSIKRLLAKPSQKDPVIAHLEEHNKSPVAGKQADHTMIEKFQSKDKKALGSAKQIEGAVETAYI